MELNEFLKRFNASASDIAALSGEEAIKAVEKDGYALGYVKDQTQEICIAAVEKDGDALQFVKESAFDVVNTNL